MDLEQEIKKASERIDKRSSELEREVSKLNSKIVTYTKWAWGFVILGAVIVLYGIIIYICKNNEAGFGLNLLGDFMSGTVASVWSLAGLVFIFIAFLGQKQQLLNQQLEIMYSQLEVKYTRLELAGQKKEMIEQNKTLRIQRFENTLFQMISNHHELIDKLSFKKPDIMGLSSDEILEKREVLEQAIEDLKSNFEWSLKRKVEDGSQTRYENIIVRSTEEAFEYLKASYDNFYFEKYRQLLSNYYRNIYHIFKFIYLSDLIEDEKKQFYGSLVRAQLSSNELFLILYNSLISGLGYPNFLFLIRELDIMQNFDFSLIEQFDFHLEIYEEKIQAAEPEFDVPNRRYE